jgi:fumarate hydratase, class II
MPKTRTERDSMGEMTVPADALYGASTARAVANFPIARRPLPPEMIHAFGHLKAACAIANRDLGKLDPKLADAIVAAADEVAAGRHDQHFPVDVYQTGSGTSTNMNANEVIANLANIRLGFGLGAKGQAGAVHPNDHVNMGQSSNDTFPTAMRIAGLLLVEYQLCPAMIRLRDELRARAEAWDHIIKTGRTHLMDATPIRVGQVFSGYAEQAHRAWGYCNGALSDLADLPIGGTAVGTGVNTHSEFARRVCEQLQHPEHRLVDFEETSNHPREQATCDSIVEAHAFVRNIAVSLSKIANDIRHLASGPRCGIGELIIPAIQPGSSIMPAKENPVIAESVMQVVCRVIGNDATITTAALGGVGSIFELNVAMPVIADAFLESVRLLTNVTNVFVDKLLSGLRVNEKRCAELVEQSLMNVTVLAPVIGYDKAAEVAKRAFAEGKTIRQITREMRLVDDTTLDKLLDPDAMTRPSAD